MNDVAAASTAPLSQSSTITTPSIITSICNSSTILSESSQSQQSQQNTLESLEHDTTTDNNTNTDANPSATPISLSSAPSRVTELKEEYSNLVDNSASDTNPACSEAAPTHKAPIAQQSIVPQETEHTILVSTHETENSKPSYPVPLQESAVMPHTENNSATSKETTSTTATAPTPGTLPTIVSTPGAFPQIVEGSKTLEVTPVAFPTPNGEQPMNSSPVARLLHFRVDVSSRLFTNFVIAGIPDGQEEEPEGVFYKPQVILTLPAEPQAPPLPRKVLKSFHFKVLTIIASRFLLCGWDNIVSCISFRYNPDFIWKATVVFCFHAGG